MPPWRGSPVIHTEICIIGSSAGWKSITPRFCRPVRKNGLSTRELKDVLPENNGEIRPVPQLLVNHPEGFLKGARLLRDLGYREINLNLGCPSGTVTAKKKGSGLLMYPEELDALLDRIFSDPMVTGGEILVSVKTRIGKNSPEEWPQLMEIYNQYPIYELTIHPRIQKDFYKNHPDLEVFSSALEASKNPVVYNGDIFTAADYRRFREQFPSVERIMLGRGLIMDPELGEKLLKIEAEETGMDRVCKETEDGPDLVRLRQFHDALFEGLRGADERGQERAVPHEGAVGPYDRPVSRQPEAGKEDQEIHTPF